jgi:hypothetical protein
MKRKFKDGHRVEIQDEEPGGCIMTDDSDESCVLDRKGRIVIPSSDRGSGCSIPVVDEGDGKTHTISTIAQGLFLARHYGMAVVCDNEEDLFFVTEPAEEDEVVVSVKMSDVVDVGITRKDLEGLPDGTRKKMLAELITQKNGPLSHISPDLIDSYEVLEIRRDGKTVAIT